MWRERKGLMFGGDTESGQGPGWAFCAVDPTPAPALEESCFPASGLHLPDSASFPGWPGVTSVLLPPQGCLGAWPSLLLLSPLQGLP